jgi:hypothetical protein
MYQEHGCTIVERASSDNESPQTNDTIGQASAENRLTNGRSDRTGRLMVCVEGAESEQSRQ